MTGTSVPHFASVGGTQSDNPVQTTEGGAVRGIFALFPFLKKQGIIFPFLLEQLIQYILIF